MYTHNAVMALVGTETSPEDEIRALQHLINAGTWELEGSIGRAMMNAIETGLCALGPEATVDYWGTPIPGRDDVEPGTVGSVEYVEQHSPYGLLDTEVEA